MLIRREPIPSWLVEGRSVLIPKSGDLRQPKNYRPITCLNTLYKILTSVIQDRILRVIGPVWDSIYEQRGAKKGVQGCKDNLLIDKSVCLDARHYKRDLHTSWLDYAKAFDTSPHDLIIRLLKMLKVHPNIIHAIESIVALWKTKFAIRAEGRTVYTGWVRYRRGVFQGDSLSPLLFCITLMPLSIELRASKIGYKAGPPGRRNHLISHLLYVDDLKLYAPSRSALQQLLNIVSDYTSAMGMSFGLDKCAVFHLRRGRVDDPGEDIQLEDGMTFRRLEDGETYKFLGMKQRGVLETTQIKDALSASYKKKLRDIWKSQLSGKNKVSATNMLAIPILTYSFGVVNWTVNELLDLDRSTRKTMNMNRSLHPNSSIQRIYLPRSQGGRGLQCLEYQHYQQTLETAVRVLRSEDPLLKFVAQHELANHGAFLFRAGQRALEKLGITGVSIDPERAGAPITQADQRRLARLIRKSQSNTLLEHHMSKSLHSIFFRSLKDQDLSEELSFAFLKSASLKSETEGFVMACQDGVINTRWYKKNIMKMDTPTTCRACHSQQETIMHILSACRVHAPSGYIERHNAALRVLYFHLRAAYEIDKEPVLPYVPLEIEAVVQNERARIYWNYPVSTTRQINAIKPDILLLDKELKELFVVEFSSPAENNIVMKEEQKRQKYKDLVFELGTMYPGHKVRMVVLIIGCLGGMRANYVEELKIIPACRSWAEILAHRMQKAVLLGSLHIIRSHEL